MEDDPARRHGGNSSRNPLRALPCDPAAAEARVSTLRPQTLIAGLEDSDDYTRFEAELRAEYAPASVLEQELVTRLASLSWRLRRLTAIETGLFQIQADALRSQASASSKLFDILYRGEPAVENAAAAVGDPTDLARCFLRVANFNKDALLLLGDCQKRTHAELAAIAMILGQRERPGFSRFSRRLTQTGQ